MQNLITVEEVERFLNPPAKIKKDNSNKVILLIVCFCTAFSIFYIKSIRIIEPAEIGIIVEDKVILPTGYNFVAPWKHVTVAPKHVFTIGK